MAQKQQTPPPPPPKEETPEAAMRARMEREMARQEREVEPPETASDVDEERTQENTQEATVRLEPRVEMNVNGTWRAQLIAGDSNPEVYPVNIETIIDSANSRLSEIAKREVEAADLGNPDANEEMQKELSEAHATRELAETLGAVFRTAGNHIWMIKPGGIDEYQMGNRLDFSGARLEFVIPESKGDDMKGQLTSLGQASGAGTVTGAFEYKKEFARLDTDTGFTMNYTYTNSLGHQQTTEVVFLYCKERVVEGEILEENDE